MTIRIDLENRTLSLGVKDLALPDEVEGSITQEASLPARAALGRGAHSSHQTSRENSEKTYRSEVTIKHETDVLDFHVTVQGRIDGVYEHDGALVVEEIKSVFNTSSAIRRLENGSDDPHILQLQFYIWLLGLETGREVSGGLVFIGIVEGNVEKLDVAFDEDLVLKRFYDRVEGIIEDARLKREWRRKQKEFANKLEFPFPSKRRYQQEMMDEVEAALLRGGDIMISAPTGVGKTIAALLPALRFTLHHGMRLFFITSKTTQQRIIVENIELLNRGQGSLTGIHIRAKEKMCSNDIYFCHPDFCQFARNYYGRLISSGAVEMLLERRTIRPEDVYQVGVARRLCPFELSLDVSLRCDVIVCDYNYVFDPSVYFRRYFLDKYDDSILIIDEAHNLYQRGMAYYSPSLDRGFINELQRSCSGSSVKVLEELAEALESLDGYFNTLDQFGTEQHGKAGKYLVNLDRDYFDELKQAMDEMAEKYYIYKQQSSVPVPEDPVQQFFRNFSHFHFVLSLEGDEFAHIYDREKFSHVLQILCCDPSTQLRKRIDGFYSTIAMSATLEPQQFYRDVLGFDRDATTLRRFPSPFPTENSRIIVIPRISTRYSVRHKFFEKTAQIISDIVAIRRGNYMVFFPSFQFLEHVLAYMPARRYEIICQQRAMSENERSIVIDRLATEKGLVVFAVQSGIFAEGVDYPGEMVIGAIIVGPGLPLFCFEQELMKYHYDDRSAMGFEYAYLYPGMNRVIQSAGRVIRSEEDKGIIVLLGQRFSTKYYSALFPPYWYIDSPGELISKDYVKDIKEFWHSISPKANIDKPDYSPSDGIEPFPGLI